MVHNIFRRKGITEWLGLSEKRISQLETDTKLVTPVSTPIITQTESNLFESTNFAQCSDTEEIRINNTTTPTSAIDEETNAAVVAYATFDDLGGNAPVTVFSASEVWVPILDAKGVVAFYRTHPRFTRWESSIHPQVTHTRQFMAGHSIALNVPGTDANDRAGFIRFQGGTGFNISASVSASLWFYPTDTTQIASETFRFLIYRYIDASNYYMVCIKPADQKVYVFVNEAGAITKLASSGTVNLNAWNLIIFTYNPSTNALVMYLNNSTASSTPADTPPTPFTSESNVNIGGLQIDSNKRFTGYLDNFVFWTGKILTGTEATNMWNRGTIV